MVPRMFVGLVLASLAAVGCRATSAPATENASASAPASVTAARLVAADSEPGQWMAHGRTYGEQRFSPLDQINTGTVTNLGLAWFADLETRRGQESTPIVVDGVLYVTTAWSKVRAYSAATGALLGGTAYAFDGAGRPAQVATGSDRIPSADHQAPRTLRATAYDYDEAGHATGVTGPGSHRESRTYNNAGWVMSETVDGVTRHYAYDIMGRPIRETGPDGVIEREYNNQGLVLAEHCVERRYAYDALGRKISEVMPATGLQVEYEYSAVRGLLLRRTEKDAAGAVLREWRYGYNPRGSMLWEEAPGGYRKDLNYDAHNRLVQVSDNAGRTTTCAYNAHGEIESENNNGAVTAYEYDAAGRRVKVTRPDGTTAEYAYDGLGRATRQTDAAGTAFTREFQPDRYQPTQTSTAGLTLRTDWSPTNRPLNRQFGPVGENFNYTATDQLQRATWELPGHPDQSVAYTWSQNNLASLQYTTPTTYSYTADGELRQVALSTRELNPEAHTGIRLRQSRQKGPHSGRRLYHARIRYHRRTGQ